MSSTSHRGSARGNRGAVGATSAAELVKAFNTWAFKREQPSDIDGLTRVVARSVAHRLPISFVLYWGKGPRAAIGAPDLQCLQFLTSMIDRMGQVYEPGAELNLVFTDTHARLNGHPEQAISKYFAEVEQSLDRARFRGHRLSNLVAHIEGMPYDDRPPDPETLDRLEKCAAKWFRGEGSPVRGAQQYFAMNMIERRAIEVAFPDSIFVTFNGSEYRSLFPDKLPIFYMYSLKKGIAVKPWFLPDADNQQSSPANWAVA